MRRLARRRAIGNSNGGVKIRHNIGDLLRVERNGRHASARAAFPDHLADQIAIVVVTHHRRTHQVRPFGSAHRILAVTETARFLKLRAAVLGSLRFECVPGRLR